MPAMRRFRASLLRFAGLFRKGRRELDLNAEFESHFDMHVADNLRRGMTPVEARREARLKFGSVDSAMESVREASTSVALEATDFADACPIATVAGEIASTHEVLRAATADVFESWLGAVERDAIAAGVPRERARPLALSVLAVLEGAFLLSRSLRTTEPMSRARSRRWRVARRRSRLRSRCSALRANR